MCHIYCFASAKIPTIGLSLCIWITEFPTKIADGIVICYQLDPF